MPDHKLPITEQIRQISTPKNLGIAAAIVGGTFVAGVLLFIVLVYAGFWGAIPTKTELGAVKNPVASEVFAADGSLLTKFYIKDRTDVKYEEISNHVIQALVATEDERFFQHRGVDVRSLARVLVKTILMGDDGSGGGSTISQQLAKNLFPRKSYSLFSMPANKVREMIIAGRIEQVYEKTEILTLYLNTVSFGELAFGIGTAADRFFSTSAKALNREQAATLVGMLKATSAYSPRLHPEKSRARRNVVIDQMAKKGYIQTSEATKLKAKDLGLQYNRRSTNEQAPYYRNQLEKEIIAWLKTHKKPDGTAYNLYTDGLKIYTTIDPLMQQYALESVQSNMKSLQKKFNDHWGKEQPWGRDNSLVEQGIKNSRHYKYLKGRGNSEAVIQKIFQTPIDMRVYTPEGPVSKKMSPKDSVIHNLKQLHAGFVAIDPFTGHIKAWVGDVDYGFFEADNVNSPRQVGSTFKPLVYAAALENGIDPCTYYTNELRTYTDYQDWTPRNADNQYGGVYSLTGGLTNSVNTVSVQVLFDVGIQRAIEFAHSLGIQSDIPEVPAIALGSAELPLFEMVAAYSSFANGGYETKAVMWTHIIDPQGKKHNNKADIRSNRHPKVMADSTAQLTVKMLESVVKEGTAQRLRWAYGLGDKAIAGKTGTTQDQADGWFMGITPKLVAGVWVGANHKKIHFRTLTDGQGSRTALPIWGSFYKKVTDNKQFASYANATFNRDDFFVNDRLDCLLYKSDSLLLAEADALREAEERRDWEMIERMKDVLKKKKEPKIEKVKTKPRTSGNMTRKEKRDQRKEEKKEKKKWFWQR